MKKNVISTLLAATMVASLLAGCGAQAAAPAAPAADKTEAAADDADEAPAVEAADGQVYYLNFKPEADEAWQAIAASYTEQTGVPVTVVTAASGTYEETLSAEIIKDEAPTLFQVNGPVGLANWADYCVDLKGSSLYNELTSDSFALCDGDAVAGIAYVIESYGIITNTKLLEEAGYGGRHIHADFVKELLCLGFEAFVHANCQCSCHVRLPFRR